MLLLQLWNLQRRILFSWAHHWHVFAQSRCSKVLCRVLREIRREAVETWLSMPS